MKKISKLSIITPMAVLLLGSSLNIPQVMADNNSWSQQVSNQDRDNKYNQEINSLINKYDNHSLANILIDSENSIKDYLGLYIDYINNTYIPKINSEISSSSNDSEKEKLNNNLISEENYIKQYKSYSEKATEQAVAFSEKYKNIDKNDLKIDVNSSTSMSIYKDLLNVKNDISFVVESTETNTNIVEYIDPSVPNKIRNLETNVNSVYEPLDKILYDKSEKQYDEEMNKKEQNNPEHMDVVSEINNLKQKVSSLESIKQPTISYSNSSNNDNNDLKAELNKLRLDFNNNNQVVNKLISSLKSEINKLKRELNNYKNINLISQKKSKLNNINKKLKNKKISKVNKNKLLKQKKSLIRYINKLKK